MYTNSSSDYSSTSVNIMSPMDPFAGERLDINSHKPYSLTYFHHPGFLHARIQAESVSPQLASEYMRAIAYECFRTGNNRLIIERDIPIAMPMAKIFFITEALNETLSDIRIAFVNPYREIDDRMAFLVLVAQNRGTEISVHRTVADAREWLLK